MQPTLHSAPHPRFGLGLAAIGRPGYITLGRATDLPADRSREALEQRALALLDAAYDRGGVRYFDAARSYGLAEAFLARWLTSRPEVDDVVVGSKWGYTYTGDWQTHAKVHEVKDHSAAAFDRQVVETRELLDGRLDLYQIHSITPDSPALNDTALHERLGRLRDGGVTVGFSTSGPRQPDAIRAALSIAVSGRPLFGSVQSTFNLLEPSAAAALAEAHDAGCIVIVKEAMANGRLADPHVVPEMTALRAVASQTGAASDTVALAAVAARPWVDVVLSGAVTVEQLTSNLAASNLRLSPAQLEQLAELAEPADAYWAHRSQLPWE